MPTRYRGPNRQLSICGVASHPLCSVGTVKAFEMGKALALLDRSTKCLSPSSPYPPTAVDEDSSDERLVPFFRSNTPANLE